MKTIKALIKDEVGQWVESFTIEDSINPFQYVEKLIHAFNNTLRHGESERTLVLLRTKMLLQIKDIPHQWSKKSLVTQKGGFDIYQCEKCKALGKRYGLQETVIVDKRFSNYCKPCS